MMLAGGYEYWRWHDRSFRRRAFAFGLALAIELLIALLVLLWGSQRPAVTPPRPSELHLFVPSELPDPAKKPAAKGEKSPVQHAQKATAPKITKPKPVITPPPPVVVPPKLITMSHDDFAATDISKLPTHGSDSGDDKPGGGNNGGAAYGPGEGPGGQRLFNAEWYREPTDAELGGYMPKNVQDPEYADIACRTIEAYHVDNCRSLGESPIGSGLSRAMRLAAWQFLVRPPRVGGKPMVGAWVRIHIYFTKRAAKE